MNRKLILIMVLLCVTFFVPLSLFGQENNKADVNFRGFAWGTSMDEVIKKMGNPVSREKADGLDSLVWENVDVSGFTAYMIAYFDKAGLQGGTYYFLTYTMDEFVKCYNVLRTELYNRFGPTVLFNEAVKELRPYESSWNLPGGYVYLMVNARQGVPVTLWYSSPELSKKIFGQSDPVSAKR